MKITTVLPPNINRVDHLFAMVVQTGIMTGWMDLPLKIQKLVEWVGIEFTSMPHSISVITVTIKIHEDKMEMTNNFIVDSFYKNGDEYSKEINRDFKEIVFVMIRALIHDQQEQTKKMENLLV
jgi:hypothetical protein